MDPEAEGRSAATRFREEHHLGTQPLGDLVAIIEQATTIDVAILDAGPDEHGLTMRDPARGAVFIGVAPTRNPMRQRSILAHELAHVVFDDWADGAAGNWSERTPIEQRADVFARHLLVPIDGLREFLATRDHSSEATLSAVVQRFLASPAIVAIAMHQAGFIEHPVKRAWMDLSAPLLAARYGWSDQYQGLQGESNRRRAPQRLLARAVRGYAQAVLPAQAIATLRGITLAEAEADLRAVGAVPVERPVAWIDSTELPDAQVDMSALDEDLDGTCGDGAARERQ